MYKVTETKTETESSIIYPPSPSSDVNENTVDARKDMILLVVCMIFVGMIMVFLIDIVRMGFGEEPVFIHSSLISDVGTESDAIKTEL